MRGFMAKLRRDVRALSPIFAVLLLIAIAVIAGIIIYMYTSGYMASMMGGGTAGQEKVAVEAVQVNAGGTITVYAINTAGAPTVNIVSVIIRDASGNAVSQYAIAAPGVPLPSGVLTPITTSALTLTSGETYTAALVSAKGNQFVSQSFRWP